MSLGSLWQSVDLHQTSLPLVMVKTCALVPTFRVQSVEPVLVSWMDSCGFCPDAYVGWSVTASTLTSRGRHGSAMGVADGDAVVVASVVSSPVVSSVAASSAPGVAALEGTGSDVAASCGSG
jgi:hypothetical protein